LTRSLRRLVVLGAAAALLVVSPAGPAASASSPPAERIGDNSLQAPGAGYPLDVCIICLIHGLAGVVPGSTGGRLNAVTINAGPAFLPFGGQLVLEVHDRDPLTDFWASGGPGSLLATAVVPGDQLPTSASSHLRIPLPSPVSVRPGMQLVVVLRLTSTIPDYAHMTVYGADAPTTMLYGYHLGIWHPFGNVQLQVATSFIGADPVAR
jgi:hypothetical protein